MSEEESNDTRHDGEKEVKSSEEIRRTFLLYDTKNIVKKMKLDVWLC